MFLLPVGLGLVLIPLPFPPPFGEVLVVGGVSVLGAEFEGPKKVMRSARNALETAVGREGDEVHLKQMESVDSGNDVTDSDENESQEKVILRDSFLTMMSQQIGEKCGDGEASTVGDFNDSNASFDINDCWTDKNIEPNIDNMYSGEVVEGHTPSPTKTFLKNVGRNYVLPFLDHVVGDRKEGDSSDKSTEGESLEKEELESFDIKARKIKCETKFEDKERSGDNIDDQNRTISSTYNEDGAVNAIENSERISLAEEQHKAEGDVLKSKESDKSVK